MGAGVAAGGCKMSMTIVGLLGFNENYVYAVVKKASAWLQPKISFVFWVYAGAIVMFLNV